MSPLPNLVMRSPDAASTWESRVRGVKPVPLIRIRLSSRSRTPRRPRRVSPTILRSQPRRLLLTARLLVLRSVQPLVLRATVHYRATAGAVSELFDRRLRLRTGGEGAVAQPVLGDVGAHPGSEVGIVMLVSCCSTRRDSGLQHTTRLEHAAHRIRPPLAKHGSAKGGLENLWGHVHFHECRKIGFS